MHAFHAPLRIAPIVALTLLGLAGVVPDVRAGDVQFQASGTFQLVSSQGTHYRFDAHGRASPGGRFDAVVEVQANNGNFDEKGVMTLDFGRGDTLSIYFEDEWLPDIGQRVGPYVVTKGTGRFAGASGSGTLTGVPAGDGTGVLYLDGTISR
jgi:hypothetical protein